MNTFPPIADYAFLSDCEVSALVAPDGSVEWLCLPRPDSPSVFGSLLDRSAGFFRFGPSNSSVPDQRRYVPGTMVLETTWHTPTGWMTVEDLLVVGPADDRRTARAVQAGARRLVSRRARCSASPPATAAGSRCRSTACRCSTTGVNAGEWSYDGAGYDRLNLHARRPVARRWRAACGSAPAARARTGAPRSHEGESAFVALSWDGAASDVHRRSARSTLTRRESFWRDWLSAATIPDHRWRPYIERSALALKGLSYAPTGAIMAAGTTSLPETPGGERNWDYRYTWIRDTAFMLRALHGLGFDWEAFEYFAFILDAMRARPTGANAADGFNLQIMYGIGGETDLTEHTLDHLSGYDDSRPGAHRQRRVRPAPARRVGDAPRLGRLAHPQRRPDRRRRRLGRHRRARRHRDRSVAPNPTRASGRCGASRSTSSRRR